jgi:4-hydroxythreonine-4-phosphate dehydrogenase
MTSSLSLRPRVGITVGDPAGIGPEIATRAAIRPEVLAVCRPVLIGDPQPLREWATRSGFTRELRILAPAATAPDLLEAPLILEPDYSWPPGSGEPSREPIEMGREQPLAGHRAAAAIVTAVEGCLAGRLEAMATAPISKTSLAMAGIQFPGHTEFLAHLTGCDDYAMTFIAPRLRVALLTTHVPLARVPGLVRRADLERLIRLVDRELRRYGIEHPRIALAGINPHAGEGGLFGDEEQREMVPAIASCRDAGIDVGGPFPGDTIFVRAARGEFDLVISCYHDQGLIPVKCFSFGEAVNVTLGLPIIRTSVDHGTAFDIAGQGIADESSMVAAICLAAELSRQRSR